MKLLKIIAVIATIAVILSTHAYVWTAGFLTGEEQMFRAWMKACESGQVLPINPRLSVRCAEVKQI